MTISTSELRRLAYVTQQIAQLERERDELDKEVSKMYGDGVHIVEDLDQTLEIIIYGAYVRIKIKE